MASKVLYDGINTYALAGEVPEGYEEVPDTEQYDEVTGYTFVIVKKISTPEGSERKEV